MMMTMLLMIFLPVGFYSLEINYYILLIKENNRDFLQVEFSDISSTLYYKSLDNTMEYCIVIVAFHT